MKTYYKVTVRTKPPYFSALVPQPAQVKYEQNKFSKAPDWLASQGYHLTVFDSPESAVDFLMIVYEFHIRWLSLWECVCENEIQLPEPMDIRYLELGELHPSFDAIWHKGTKMFERVKLVNMIESYTPYMSPFK